jgi:two-component system sensor histidine kinase KdpD
MTGKPSHYLLAVGSFIILTAIAWSLRETLTLANFTMLYILFVLIVAIRLGTYAAMMIAFASFLSINFFLTHPYYTFLVYDSREVIDLVVFIIVAMLSGQLGARARQQTYVANQRAKEQEILYKLTRLMNQATDAPEVHQVLNQVLAEELLASRVDILPGETLQRPVPPSKAHLLLLKAGDHIYGTVLVAFAHDLSLQERHLLSTCVTQSAMALQRIELAERVRVSQQYEEADRLKTAILRAVSHDLRTPITIIKTSASNLRTLSNHLTESERLELAQTVENEADHLNTLVGNLLDLSRLQAGAVTLNQEPNSLEEVAGDVAARVWQITGQERVIITFPEDMPLVCFDYGLLLQAMSNLIDNALRYEPSGRQIVIEGGFHTEQAWVRIINHGESISPTERDQIMEPFFYSKDGHFGLGLPIAKGIIEAHHGTLALEDTPGGGATFIMQLPLSGDSSL